MIHKLRELLLKRLYPRLLLIKKLINLFLLFNNYIPHSFSSCCQFISIEINEFIEIFFDCNRLKSSFLLLSFEFISSSCLNFRKGTKKHVLKVLCFFEKFFFLMNSSPNNRVPFFVIHACEKFVNQFFELCQEIRLQIVEQIIKCWFSFLDGSFNTLLLCDYLNGEVSSYIVCLGLKLINFSSRELILFWNDWFWGLIKITELGIN